ncbi:hypothetical protein ACW9HQ_43845, partial [Nocardia gipuzkoensis]
VWVRVTEIGAALTRLRETLGSRADPAAAQRIIRDGSRPPLVVVVDDAHRIAEPTAVTALQDMLLAAAPHVTVVLTARHDPPLHWHALELPGRLFRLGAKDIAFTEPRAGQLCRQSGCVLTAAELATVMATTHGWAALVRMAATHLATHPDRTTALTEWGEVPATVSDFLTEEVIDPLPERLRRFVSITCVPVEFPAALAQHLTGAPARPLLDDLRGLGFPILTRAN